MDKVQLPNESASYLPTLYGKALDSRAEHPILADTFADEVVHRIDFDFETLRLAQGGAITLPIRAKHLDSWTREFLAAHPSATVLHLGCGLDSRVFRIDPPATVRWFDVDLPDVIDLRRKLYPERREYRLIATSVTDLRWLDEVPADRPVIVVAEGLMQYLPEPEALALFKRITTQFPSGQILFDAYSRLTVRVLSLFAPLIARRTRSTATGDRLVLPWGIDDPHKLESQVPGLRLMTAVSFLTMPELVEHLVHSRAQAVVYRILASFGWYQRSMLHLRYEF